MVSVKQSGLRDIRDGLLSWRLWMSLAWGQVQRRYRRTAIGPFWTTLSCGIFIAAVGVLYPKVFNRDPSEYLPFLCSGLIIWWPLTAFLTEAANAFTDSSGIAKQRATPFTIFLLTAITRNFIVFCHHVLIYVLVVIYYGVEVNANMLLVLPGLTIFLLNGCWVGLLLATLCARYRDLVQVLISVIQISFFVTPIFWVPNQVGGWQEVFVEFNLLYHLIEVVRAPMLGNMPSTLTWSITVGMIAVGMPLTMMFFQRYRNRIIFWI